MTNNQTIEIREYKADDFENILPLLRQLWPDKNLDENALKTVFKRVLISDNQLYFCAISDSKIIGFGSLTIKNNLWQEGFSCHIDELIVDVYHRKNGIGTRLLQHLENIAKERNCRRIELDSAFHRKKAHTFYKNLGYENRAYLLSKIL
jgi:glucosamine-phosphate N-acetyltransferase